MAELNLDALDDPVVVDACTGFEKGQQSYEPPDQLEITQAAQLVNVDIAARTAATRRGTVTLGEVFPERMQGLTWYDTPTEEYLVAVSGGSLSYYDETSWEPLDSYTGSLTGQFCFAQLIDKLYFVDGASNMQQWDGPTDAMTDLGSTPGSPGDPPVGARFLISAYGLLWAAGMDAAQDELWVSYFLDGTQWHAGFGNIRIGGGEGDPITGLCDWDDYQIVVFKRNSIYILKFDPSQLTFADATHGLGIATVTKISDNLGCVSHRSIARVGSDIWFLSDGGVFSVGRVLAQTQREVKQANSLPVQDIIDRVNWSAATTAAAAFWDNRYFLSLPLEDDAAPSTLLVFNTQRQAWSGTWTGWEPTCWALSKANGDDRLNFGREDGAVRRWLDYIQNENAIDSTWQDNGANVETRVRSRAMIFNDGVAPKSLLSVQVEFYGSESNVSLGVALDEQEPVTLNASFPSNPGILLLPFLLPATLPNRGLKRRAFGGQHLQEFRSVQVEVISPAGKMALRALILSGFINTPRLEQ